MKKILSNIIALWMCSVVLNAQTQYISTLNGNLVGNGGGLTNIQATNLAGAISVKGADVTVNSNLVASFIYSTNFYPYPANKTYWVFMGDSITASLARPSYPGWLTNNLIWWGSLYFSTNQAVAGQNFAQQTNIFWTTTFPLLPQNPTGGTNVIISMMIGRNDGSPNYDPYIAGISNFVAQIHSYGWKFMGITVLPTVAWYDTTGNTNTDEITRVKLNNAILFGGGAVTQNQYTNTDPTAYGYSNGIPCDFVFDAAKVLPNASDTNFYNVDGIHPNGYAHTLLGKEMDRALRFGTREWQWPVQLVGIYYDFKNPFTGQSEMLIDTNGAILPGVRGGQLTTFDNHAIGGLFGTFHGSVPALVAQAAVDTIASSVIFRTETSNGSPMFKVAGDGSFQTPGGVSQINAGSLQFNIGSGGNHQIQFTNQTSSEQWEGGGDNTSNLVWGLGNGTLNTNISQLTPGGQLTITGDVSAKIKVAKTNAVATITTGLEATNGTDPTPTLVQFSPSVSLRFKTYNSSSALPEPSRWDIYGVGTNSTTNYSSLYFSVTTNNAGTPINAAELTQDGGLVHTTDVLTNSAASQSYAIGVGSDKSFYISDKIANAGRFTIDSTGTNRMGALIVSNAFVFPNGASNGLVWISDNSGKGSWQSVSNATGGTVTSVALAAPAYLTVTGSPIATSGTLTLVGNGSTATFDSSKITNASTLNTVTANSETITNGLIVKGTISTPSGGLLSSNVATQLDVSNIIAASSVPANRIINTTTPLGGGGPLSSDLTISIAGLSGLGSGNSVVAMNLAGTAFQYQTNLSIAGLNVTNGITNLGIYTGSAAGLTSFNLSQAAAGLMSFYEPQKWGTLTNVMEATLGWEDVCVEEPSVQTNVSGTTPILSMIYTGTNNQLGYAWSLDGTNWNKKAGPIMGLGVGGVANPACRPYHIKFGSTWYLYFTTNTSGTGASNILYATSTDGSNYTFVGNAFLNTNSMGNSCVASNPVDNLFYMGWEHLNVATSQYTSGWATSSAPTGPFVIALTNDTTLDTGLGGYSVGQFKLVNGVWHNWYHVQNGTLWSTIVHAYTTNVHLTNWTIATWNPIFTSERLITQSLQADQVADAKGAGIEFNGNTYFYCDAVNNSASPRIKASILMACFPGALTNAISPGTQYVSRGIRVGLNSNTAIPQNTITQLFMTNVLNGGMLYDRIGGNIIIETPGFYHVNYSGLYSTALGTGASEIFVYTNGVSGPVFYNGTVNQQTMVVSDLLYLNQGTKVGFYINNGNSGGATAQSDASGGCHASLNWVGP